MNDFRFGVSPVNYPDPDPGLRWYACPVTYKFEDDPIKHEGGMVYTKVSPL